MKRFSENRFLADLYTKDQVHAVFLQELIDRMDNIAKSAGVAMVGDLAPPPPVNAINVKASGEMVHVTLTHAAELTRAIEYHVEADTNPNFTAPQIVSQGSRRTHMFNLPGFNDTGGAQPWYIRAYAQYPGSKPSQPLVFGGLANPTPITLKGGAGGTKLTPLGSTGSGTASTTGQQGGSGRGKFRVSTPKVIRVGKSQASVQPTQTTVQSGGQPVIIFTPQPNGNTPPVVVVDQSGNNGIDFGGGTPISKRLSAAGVAFADLSGNLILKNIANAVGTTAFPTTTSTSYVVVPEMTITLTTKGNPVLIIFTGNFGSGTTNSIADGFFAIFKDAVQLSQDFEKSFLDSSASPAYHEKGLVAISYIDSPTAASHTYDVRWKVTGSVGIQGGSSINGLSRSLQIVELG